jgi:hypothetical protein
LEIRICAAPNCGNEFEAFPVNKKFCSITCKRKADSKGATDIYSDTDSLFQSYQPLDATEIEERELFYALAGSDMDATYKLDFVRKENARLNNLVNKHKSMADEILDAVYKAMSENLKQVTVRPPKNSPRKSYKEELVCNPTNADTQLGKVTPSYNSDVAAERIELYTSRVIEYAEALRHTSPITRAHVWFLGDIVEGEGIFPSQPHVIDTSVYAQVAKNGPEIYASQLRRLLEVFDEVVVTAVIGNHGRLSKFHNPESNMDRMLYKILEHIFAYEPRIKFNIPDGHGESMFWAVDAIGNYSTLLLHGDQLPAPTSGATYQRRILGWKSGAIPVPFDDVIMGHWHQNTKMTINQTVVRISGSPESNNTFAQERLSAVGRPSQHLQFISPVNGVYWESDIYLDY